LTSVVELNTVSGVGQYLGYETFELQQFFFGHVMSCDGPGQRRARTTDALGPVFAAYEGYSIYTARYLDRLIGAVGY
jgi:hypothetical protein